MDRIPTLVIVVSLLLGLSTASTASARAPEAPLQLLVTSTEDQETGACSSRGCTLRDAILAANDHRGPAHIRMALPNPPYSIRLARPLPALGADTLLDGTRLPEDCPRPGLHIDGAGVTAANSHGLVLAGDGSALRGVAVTGFTGHGILVQGRGNQVSCSHSGVLPDGFTAAPNLGDGIRVQEAADTLLGGEHPADAVLAGANEGWGMRMVDAFLTRQRHLGIGTNAEGRGTLPNGDLTRPDQLAALPQVEASDNPDTVRRNITRVMERQLEGALDAPNEALLASDLLTRYGALITRRGERSPATFAELFQALGETPELQAPFLAEYQAIIASGEQTTLDVLLPWLARMDWAVPHFGTDLRASREIARDALSETLAQLDPDQYSLSKADQDILAVALQEPPLGLFPLVFAGLTTYGPTSVTTPVNAIPYHDKICQGGVLLCTWPVIYDLFPLSATLYYTSPTLSVFELDDIVEDQGFQVRLNLNGQPLVKGPPPWQQPGGNPGATEYWLARLPAAQCPGVGPCIAVNLLVRHKAANTPMPWQLELVVRKQVPVPPTPVLDKFGQVVIVSTALGPFSTTTTTINPNGTNGDNFFVGALSQTFQSERCQSCHSLKTVSALYQHHDQYFPQWWPNVQAFDSQNNVQFEPSAYVPGGHVITCFHCHANTVPLADDHGDPFHETEWKAPAADLDIDWALKTPAQMCNRVITNLPSHALRHEHFHEDARLFWAIQDPQAPAYGPDLQAAFPMNWDNFLARVDLWNLYGARCP